MSATCGASRSACARLLPLRRHARGARGARGQPLRGVHVQRGERRGAGERVRGIGVAVEQLDHFRRAAHERFVALAAHQHAPMGTAATSRDAPSRSPAYGSAMAAYA